MHETNSFAFAVSQLWRDQPLQSALWDMWNQHFNSYATIDFTPPVFIRNTPANEVVTVLKSLYNQDVKTEWIEADWLFVLSISISHNGRQFTTLCTGTLNNINGTGKLSGCFDMACVGIALHEMHKQIVEHSLAIAKDKFPWLLKERGE